MKAIDLFAGCGGLSLGFQNAGVEVVGAFDNWKESCDVYAANFAHPIFQTDLSDIENVGQFKEWDDDTPFSDGVDGASLTFISQTTRSN
ncbi:MAG: DNA cytosine methyltransferase [Symplocastrum torsivum CPER-KK1]|jgi:DNA (cytosine-5)-methyltransferase 1|uniref:DNA cytosine methyltransferase n=1 Tax=Symplocastrum torsivum CPER-KK1 TaxID=450513 RepID=A0A951PRH5_9CYAN|nr:DNA cytosine methyltransferase [Symplocastrum torsivum CPER-KK1]